jgi:uncharacterized BrkB/YihY/UPF0761 family membrane protein
MVQKYQNDTLQISISFFSLQEKPALLVPWMVFTLVFLIANIILFIVYAVNYFSINDTAGGVGSIIETVVFVCK